MANSERRSNMVSDRIRESNRRNALRSTGPRTQSGKRRASGNARKHGLSISIGEDASFSAEIDELARMLVPDATGAKLVLARKLAEAEVDVIRVRAARASVVRLETARHDAELPPFEHGKPSASGQELSTSALHRSDRFDGTRLNALPELAQLERYARRAFSRRTRALRALLQT